MPSLTLHGKTVERTSPALPLPLPSWARTPAELAEHALLSALAGMLALHACEAEIVEAERRLQAADEWFSTRAPHHPHWDAAEARRNGIAAQQRGMEAVLPLRYRVVFVACGDLHVALEMLPAAERAAWCAQNGLGGVPAHPNDIWVVVAGSRAVPGAWPLEDRLWFVEARPRTAELWQIPELRELVKVAGA